jgi:hypothetical protein
MNWEECGLNHSWPNLKYSIAASTEGTDENYENLKSG